MSLLSSLRELPPPWRTDLRWSVCLVIILIGLFTGLLASVIYGVVSGDHAPLSIGACFNIAAPGCAIGCLAAVAPRGGLAAKLGIRRLTAVDGRAILAGLFAVYVFNIATLPAWGWLLRLLDIPFVEKQSLLEVCAGATVPEFIWLLLLVAVVIPVGEELFFRRLLFGALLPVGTVGAVLLSALLFGVAHWFIYGIWALTFFGAVLQLLYLRTGNLLTNILAHAVFNLISLCAAFFFGA